MSGGTQNVKAQPQIPPGAKRPKVGILYSSEASQERSTESCNLAYYLCALLCATGYAEVSMIPYESNPSLRDPCTSPGMRKRIKYIPVGQRNPIEISVSAATFTLIHRANLTSRCVYVCDSGFGCHFLPAQ